MEYLISNPLGDVDIKAFEESCGVGILVTPEQIEQEVEKLIKKYHSELVEKRYVYKIIIYFYCMTPNSIYNLYYNKVPIQCWTLNE